MKEKWEIHDENPIAHMPGILPVALRWRQCGMFRWRILLDREIHVQLLLKHLLHTTMIEYVNIENTVDGCMINWPTCLATSKGYRLKIVVKISYSCSLGCCSLFMITENNCRWIFNCSASSCGSSNAACWSSFWSCWLSFIVHKIHWHAKMYTEATRTMQLFFSRWKRSIKDAAK